MRHLIMTLGILPLTLMSGTTRSTASEEHLVGNWYGYTSVDSLPQFVKVHVTDQSLKIAYEAPRSCLIEAVHYKTGVYRLTNTSCEHVRRTDDLLKLRKNGDRLRYDITDRSTNLPVEVGYLRANN